MNPSSVVHSFGLGQFNCRRLWGRDGAVHDGFMGLVSCLNQLDLQVLCVQETQSPLMGTLPTDQPFRYDALLEVMAAKRVFCSIPPSFRLPFQGLRISSLSVGVWSQVSSAFAHSTRSVNARVEFWCTLACSVHHVSHTHPGVTNVACWGLQCVASPFPAWLVATSRFLPCSHH